MYKNFFIQQVKKGFQKGVTLVEMLVVLGIFVAVSSVLLFNYSDFNSSTSLRNTTQNIGLTIRQAQTYATNVQNTRNVIAETVYPESYGLHFGLDEQPNEGNESLAIASPKTFILFKDITNENSNPAPNKTYDTWGSGFCGVTPSGILIAECVSRFSIASQDRFSSFCVPRVGGGEDCYTNGFLDITFRRPSPDAIICLRSNTGFNGPEGVFPPLLSCDRGVDFSYVKIGVRSVKGDIRTITVWNTGQISID